MCKVLVSIKTTQKHDKGDLSQKFCTNSLYEKKDYLSALIASPSDPRGIGVPSGIVFGSSSSSANSPSRTCRSSPPPPMAPPSGTLYSTLNVMFPWQNNETTLKTEKVASTGLCLLRSQNYASSSRQISVQDKDINIMSPDDVLITLSWLYVPQHVVSVVLQIILGTLFLSYMSGTDCSKNKYNLGW